VNFNKHFNLEGKHAFLGASKWHWINYDEDRLVQSYFSFNAAAKGTMIHDFASRCINLGQHLPNENVTLNLFVNNAIDDRMKSEVVLYYSHNCFGTADAIRFDESACELYIYDLKAGTVPAHMEQLEIYNALFCLEYDISPVEIQTELRIYQNDEILYHKPQVDDIAPIIDRIITFDKVIDDIKYQEEA